jgi:deoxyribodipyrimidine photo-lyase
VYNPIKQAQDHDPQGRFVRQWLPAMRQVPDTWLFEPWHMPHTLQAHPGLWAQPIVDLAQATREAKQLLHSRRQTDEVKVAKKAVIDKHASRKNWGKRSTTRRTAGAPSASADASKQQLGFDF